MNKLSRRRLLVIGGTGAIAVLAGGAALAVRQFTKPVSAGRLTFQAVAALPRPPLVSYASYVIAGQVNLADNTGTITKTANAGDPDHMLPIAFFTRTVRVTSVETQGSTQRITGVIVDPAQLQKGEPASFSITIDPGNHTAQTDYFGDPIHLQLKEWNASSQ